MLVVLVPYKVHLPTNEISLKQYVVLKVKCFIEITDSEDDSIYPQI